MIVTTYDIGCLFLSSKCCKGAFGCLFRLAAKIEKGRRSKKIADIFMQTSVKYLNQSF